jgi:hypothetical protein
MLNLSKVLLIYSIDGLYISHGCRCTDKLSNFHYLSRGLAYESRPKPANDHRKRVSQTYTRFALELDVPDRISLTRPEEGPAAYLRAPRPKEVE